MALSNVKTRPRSFSRMSQPGILLICPADLICPASRPYSLITPTASAHRSDDQQTEANVEYRHTAPETDGADAFKKRRRPRCHTEHRGYNKSHKPSDAHCASTNEQHYIP